MDNYPDTGHVAQRLTDYLLGEVTVQERDAIRAHLVTCRDCAAEEAALRRSITHVEDALRSDRRAPDDFTERVMRRIGAGQHSAPLPSEEGHGVPALRKRHTSRKGTPFTLPVHAGRGGALRFATAPRSWMLRSWKWALALSVALVGATALQHERDRPGHPAVPHTRPGPRISPPSAPVTLTLPAMLTVYRDVSRAPDVSEIGTTDPWGVAAALTPRVGFPVAPVDLSAQGALTRGARVGRLLGRPVAVSVLAFRGRVLTLYQMPSRGVSLPAMPVMNAAGKRILCGGATDCHLVAWRSGGRLFVLVGDVPDRALVMLAGAVRDYGGVA